MVVGRLTSANALKGWATLAGAGVTVNISTDYAMAALLVVDVFL